MFASEFVELSRERIARGFKAGDLAKKSKSGRVKVFTVNTTLTTVRSSPASSVLAGSVVPGEMLGILEVEVMAAVFGTDRIP